ncbi:hypothetical protein BDN71DRAFT_1591507 [Pleurotus eryngii]|uniref:Uncharacterized protein n=1 Tax=Pleurotus eryngii TaxID=5323 RepID=A0A9P6DDC3_PLEER|nr:hypothetical protein BDN71DRAFT_1591507 [Pleurotus eryngii]
MTVWRFMKWLNNGSSAKSETDADRLVHDVLLSSDFKVTDLHEFSANRENKRLDNATSESPGPFDNFKTAKIDISVPSGDKNKLPTTYSIPGLYYRDLISVIKAAFTDPITAKYHLSPFKLFHQRPGMDSGERVYGGAAVNNLLKASSSIPVLNTFTSHLTNAARPDDRFDTSRILVVDLLHEFKLGVWKALFTHLICMLYASPNGGQLVDKLNLRYRSTPTFGNSMIRKFANNAADMKKLADLSAQFQPSLAFSPSHTQHDSNVLPSAAAEELDVPPECHFVISPSRSHPLPLSSFLKNDVADPARKDFLPKLQAHIFSRLRKESFSASDLSLGYTGGERNTVRILGNKIFSVQTMCINFTSYDIRQDQDCLNPRTDNCDIMLYAPDGDDDNYWYARVLGIFHAKVLLHGNHSSISQQPSHIEFLWVRWFGSVSGYHGGMHQAKLPKVGFVEDTVSDDNYAFGFLDPSLVLQACHLIPDFPTGRTNDRLASYPGSYARRPDETNDWAEFYVNIFIDRDMCMRYFPGGGIGHCTFSTQLPLDCTNQDTETEVEEGEIELPMAESDSDDSDDSDISSGTESVYSDDDELDVEAQYGFDSL